MNYSFRTPWPSPSIKPGVNCHGTPPTWPSKHTSRCVHDVAQRDAEAHNSRRTPPHHQAISQHLTPNIPAPHQLCHHRLWHTTTDGPPHCLNPVQRHTTPCQSTSHQSTPHTTSHHITTTVTPHHKHQITLHHTHTPPTRTPYPAPPPPLLGSGHTAGLGQGMPRVTGGAPRARARCQLAMGQAAAAAVAAATTMMPG